MVLSSVSARLVKVARLVTAPEWLLLRRWRVSLEHYLHLKSPWWQRFGFETIVDIGANTGQFVHLARHVFPTAKVVAFEPQSDAVRVLQKSVAGDSNVQVFHAACGATNSQQSLFRNAFSPAASLLPIGPLHLASFPNAEPQGEEQVRVVQLDDVMESLGPLGRTLIKVDVQGFESEVITGGRKTFSHAIAAIIEVSFVPLYKGQPFFGDIHAQLVQLGLKMAGFIDQLSEPTTGQPLQADAVFVR